MSTQKIEKQIAQLQADLAENKKQQTETERAPERLERQLVAAQVEEDSQAADVRRGHGSAEDLAAAMRETAALKATLEKLKRETGPKLDKLRAEEQKLRDDLARTNREIAKVRLSEAVDKYQPILREALPHADAIRRHAAAAGVMLPPNYNDDDHHLIERGTFVIGGVVVDLR